MSFILISNEEIKTNTNKIKPILVGNQTEGNIINVVFSKSNIIRGLYSYEHQLTSRSIAVMYLMWQNEDGRFYKLSELKRAKFAEHMNSKLKNVK